MEDFLYLHNANILGDFVINLLINVFITKSLISLVDINATASITMFLR